MKTVVGFTFTDNPLRRLSNAGFLFHRNEASLVNGYREFLCPLARNLGGGQSIEIREVIDEISYLKFQGKNNFCPFESESSNDYSEIKNPNTIYFTEGIIGEEIEDGELKDYLKIRKQYPIWALWLKCLDAEKFNTQVVPDRHFKFHNEKAALIHLGQSCYDLIVTGI